MAQTEAVTASSTLVEGYVAMWNETDSPGGRR